MPRDESATLDAMRRAGVALTLENWLAWNSVPVGELLSAELRETIPECLRAQFDQRLKFQHDYRHIDGFDRL